MPQVVFNQVFAACVLEDAAELAGEAIGRRPQILLGPIPEIKQQSFWNRGYRPTNNPVIKYRHQGYVPAPAGFALRYEDGLDGFAMSVCNDVSTS